MKLIVPIGVIAILLLQLSGTVPNSSVGGPMTIAFCLLVGALAVGIHEAWSKRRGVLGWIASPLIAFVGGLLGALVCNSILESIMPFLHLNGSLVSTGHPMLYVSLAASMVLTLLGAWLALDIANRWR